ncbi:2og-fe oxygenase family protein [Ophiostoma piceae UAMH 11346]|uniref:2og-fe oxygenase family protein n=1 Tax=Ophiostoma piceae (strain UAMH 11346) TaxID=1262450 RepID=S3D5Z5_OPHP1|nr:2og-fe oxygenase family protein [Ophiostoma piceae UAMH 11346]
MYGYAAVVCLAGVLFWLDPILRVMAPSLVPATPMLRRTPRPPINEALLALEDAVDAGIECPADSYTVHIYNKAPLVLYVEDFLSLDERKHLIDISNLIYEPSTITHNGGGSVQRNALVRDSEVAVVPRTDVVRCIEARARRLQGWRDDLWVERLRVQRYVAPSGHYGYHYDWSRSGAATGGWGRVSSLMVFVDDGELDSSASTSVPLKGGGTAFPPGNAVFWENFRPDGSGRAYEETWHAGLRVEDGTKVGLNIWSWGRVD